MYDWICMILKELLDDYLLYENLNIYLYWIFYLRVKHLLCTANLVALEIKIYFSFSSRFLIQVLAQRP